MAIDFLGFDETQSQNQLTQQGLINAGSNTQMANTWYVPYQATAIELLNKQQMDLMWGGIGDVQKDLADRSIKQNIEWIMYHLDKTKEEAEILYKKYESSKT